MKSKIWIASLVALLVIITYFLARPQFEAPQIQANSATLRVTKNATLQGIVENLYSHGFIKNKLAFKTALLLSKDTTPTEKGAAIKIGWNTIGQEAVYTISRSMNAWDLAYVLLNRGRAFDCNHGCPEGVIWEGETPFRPVGLLKGKLTIGPLCPVGPCPSPIQNPYSNLQLVLKGEGQTQYPRINSDGEFELEVPAGKYVLTATSCSYLGCKNEFPKEITVEENKTVSIEISLDTGIR